MSRNKVTELTRRRYACSLAARWLPRALAAAALVAALLAAHRFDPQRGLSLVRPMQGVIIVAGAAVALWIARSGGELRLTIEVARDRLSFSRGRRSLHLAFEEVQRFDYESPLGASRKLWPATVVVDKLGRPWRLPALIRGGDRLVAELVAASGRDDLAAWAESLGLQRRMSRAGALTAAGYTACMLIVAAAALFYLR